MNGISRRELLAAPAALTPAPAKEDHTSALQRDIDRALSGGGSRRVKLPAGRLLLSGPLRLHGEHVVGLEVVGEQLGTVLVQTIPNTPIFELRATGISHSNHFEGFTASWADRPARAHKKSCAFYMPSTGGSDFFNSSFERITQLGGDRLIRSEGPSFWGNRCIEMTIGGGATGGFGYFVPDHKTGQPNNYFERHYLHGEAMTGPLYVGAAMAAEMRAIEVNAGLLGPRLISDEGGGQYNIGHLRVEVASYAAPTGLFHLPNGEMVAETIELSLDCRAPVWLIEGNNNPRSFYDVQQVVVGATGIGGFQITRDAAFAGAMISGRPRVSVGRLIRLQ